MYICTGDVRERDRSTQCFVEVYSCNDDGHDKKLQHEVKHVYVEKATILRPDLVK